METRLVSALEPDFEGQVISLGAAVRRGEVVSFPTETVYGLGADGLNGDAVKKIYQAKGRPSDNPLILHVSGIAQAETVARSISPLERKLMNQFWPGPLTLVLPKSEQVPDETSAGLDTVGVRCPAHPAAQALIRAAGRPLAAPSANLSGKPSPTTAEGVMHDMKGRIFAVIDGGPCRIGLESTVISCAGGHIVIYRPGAVTLEELREFAPAEIDRAVLTGSSRPKAPGMKYRHYAPSAPLTVYVGHAEEVENKILTLAQEKAGKYGFFVSRETAARLPEGLPLFVWGRRGDHREMAHRLFEGLLYFNAHPVEQIIGEGTDTAGIGMAIMNRLTKASGYHIIIEETGSSVHPGEEERRES